MDLRVATLLTLFLAAAGCGPAGEEPAGRSAIDAFAAGAFLPRDPWLDVRDLHRAQRAAEAEPEAWRVPAAPWLAVADGWGGAEEWGAWGLGQGTRIRFVLRSVRPYDFFIACMTPPDPDQRRQTVTVRVNGSEIGSFTVAPDWQEHRLPLPEGVLRPGLNELELAYAFHLAGRLETDDRPLALAFERLGLVPAGHKPPASGPPFRIYRDQEILVLEASGTYMVPLDVPAGTLALELASRGETELDVGTLTVDGREQTIVTLSSVAGRPFDGDHELELAGRRGSPILVTFDADLAAGSRLTIRRPRIVAGEAAATAEPAPALAGERPHVILIVLDAARADHFGVYGYDRETTPYIDRLAAESLVFRNAVAECSYTLCSMPSLLTGLTYAQHGMIGKEMVLKDEVETLAEKLRAAGYLTVGFTGNPNNSRITGTHQGFDEFRELWKTHPRHITRRVVRRLRKGTGGRPLFLMLHYVPPHEPYAPDPEFDVFGDPAYSGPVTSDRAFTRAVYAREIVLDEADLAEMVALYDGNLRMADAAVGRVLAVVKEHGLYDDALVIVTSDHGEAFLEHGKVGHNSTIYDEMLRVPLIVKLPAAWAARLPEGVDFERLVTLADVAPTIYRLLGLEPPPAVRTPDLLAPAAAAPERVVYLRSAQVTDPILGVRTGRFKALAANGRGPELYDLLADPGEEVNLSEDRALLYAGLNLILARALGQSSELRAGARGGEISEEDKAMLKALGYL